MNIFVLTCIHPCVHTFLSTFLLAHPPIYSQTCIHIHMDIHIHIHIHTYTHRKSFSLGGFDITRLSLSVHLVVSKVGPNSYCECLHSSWPSRQLASMRAWFSPIGWVCQSPPPTWTPACDFCMVVVKCVPAYTVAIQAGPLCHESHRKANKCVQRVESAWFSM